MDLILIKVSRQNVEALIDMRPEPVGRNRVERSKRREAALAEIALALEAKPGTADLSTEETKASLAARLLALASALQTGPGGDITTAKMVFDLRAAAELLHDLDELVAAIIGDEDADTYGLAYACRERLDQANPELRG